MKTQLLNIFITALLFAPATVISQAGSVSDQDLTGVWKGALYNDTTHQYLAYEIAISKEKGKLTGYSYTQFENTDKAEWIIKKIKIKQKGEQLIIEDVEHIINTFNEPPPRGVRWMGIVDFHADDTSLQLHGKWSTSRTKEYSPATGSIQVKRASNYRPLTIIKRLHELDLDETLSFVAVDQNRTDVAVNTSKPVQTKPDAVNAAIITNTGVDAKSTADPSKNVNSRTVETTAVQNVNTASTSTGSKAGQKPVQNNKPDVNPGVTSAAANLPTRTGVAPGNETVKVEQKGTKPDNQNNVAKETSAAIVTSSTAQSQKIKNPEATQAVLPKAVPAGKEVAVAASVSTTKQNAAIPPNQSSPSVETAVNKQVPETTPISSPAPLNRINEHPIGKEVTAKAGPLNVNTAIKPIAMDLSAAANVSKRTISNTQEVFYQSDSLILSLYDNGEVDGDTVSVLLNGNIIFAKQGLTTRANSKVIYISPDTPDSLMLVMYAENLGSIPPNTGLLVVGDGEKIYDLRFRADLQSNAAIILRRKRP